MVGGRRHLALAGDLIRGRALAWPTPMADAFAEIAAVRPAVVLASGDPFCFGIGAQLAPLGPFLCIPAPSAFSLACARLGWALQDTATLSFCGRPLEALAPLLQPGRRVLALSAGAETPAAVASYLRTRGFGPSRLHVMEALGGPGERIRTRTTDFAEECDPLNLVGIEVAAGGSAKMIPLAAGLPDAFFENDGQITRREIRAMTLSALAPLRGELLWDIGCGSGSIAIEWMLRDGANRAIGIDRSAERAARAMRNALALGVPGLEVRVGAAPDALAGFAAPDAVFIGGGAQDPAVIDAAWAALRPGGRLVVNAVTIDTAGVLYDRQLRHGGELTRIAIERLDMIGTMRGFRPAMAVTQWAVVKP